MEDRDDMDNLHASAVALEGRGVAIIGMSGAGKSALAIELIRRWHAAGRSACLIADDRILARNAHGRLVVSAPRTIAGLIEIRGFGPSVRAHEPAAVIDLLVVLADHEAAPRHREDISQTICGVELACLVLPRGDARGAADAIDAWMTQPPGELHRARHATRN